LVREQTMVLVSRGVSNTHTQPNPYVDPQFIHAEDHNCNT